MTTPIAPTEASGAAAMPPSNDARTLIHTAVPTAAAGVVAVAAAAVLAGGKGAIGAAVGTLVVVLFMGMGLVVLQRTAKSLPHLFQAMGLMLYTAQLLLLFMFMAMFKDTDLFDPKVFALTLLATTLVWVAAQARAYMKAKILYVEPEGTKGAEPRKTGSST
jgi:ATP synthase protein I